MAETIFFSETDMQESVQLSAEEITQFQRIADGVGSLSVGAIEFGIIAGPEEKDDRDREEEIEEAGAREGEGPRR